MDVEIHHDGLDLVRGQIYAFDTIALANNLNPLAKASSSMQIAGESPFRTSIDLFFLVLLVFLVRGNELHGPGRIYLNANSIIFVEPVGTDSKVAQLIAEANQQK